MKALTANRLIDGDVVFWKAGKWVERFADADLFDDPATAELAEGQAKSQPTVVIDPYLIDLMESDGLWAPLSYRERIRALGPTNHPTHGKPFKAAAKGKRGVTAWVEREVNKRGSDHTAHGCRERQRGQAHAGECAFVNFATDFHADHEEEDRHQAIVDQEVQALRDSPAADGERNRGMPEMVIAVGIGRVGPDQCGGGSKQQDNAAECFDVEEFFEGSESAFGKDLRARQGRACWRMWMHVREYSRVAARPTRYLSAAGWQRKHPAAILHQPIPAGNLTSGQNWLE